MVFGTPIFVQSSRAQGSEPELVPEPNLREIHNFNKVNSNEIQHEYWSLTMRQGDTLLNLIASNATQQDMQGNWLPPLVNYQQNTQYFVGNINYIASLSISDIVFLVGGQTVTTNLTNCEDFGLSYSPIRYNGTVPGFTCNITYFRVHVYPGTPRNSTFDLTIIQHVNVNWTQTSIKVEALFELGHTRLLDPFDTEYSPDEPFSIEIKYGMYLNDATQPLSITPSYYSNTSLVYNITRSNGTPLTVARLGMKNDFAAYNSSGSVNRTGYSSMLIGGDGPGRPVVTHGFPNLSYLDTTSMKSDPEITVSHDRISATSPATIWAIIIVGAAVGIAGIALFLKKRKPTTAAAFITT